MAFTVSRSFKGLRQATAAEKEGVNISIAALVVGVDTTEAGYATAIPRSCYRSR